MALLISILSLFISGLTFWLSRINKGKLKMTRPTIICFLDKNGGDEPKVFIRMLLYSTSDQGRYIQNIFARLSRAGTAQNFDVWAYGETNLVRGSGLFVSKSGISIYHHFLLSKNEKWEFSEGAYKLEIFAETVVNKSMRIFDYDLRLTSDQANDLKIGKAVYFDWIPSKAKYLTYSDERKAHS